MAPVLCGFWLPLWAKGPCGVQKKCRPWGLNPSIALYLECVIFGNLLTLNTLICKIQTTVCVCSSLVVRSIYQNRPCKTGMTPYLLGRDTEI